MKVYSDRNSKSIKNKTVSSPINSDTDVSLPKSSDNSEAEAGKSLLSAEDTLREMIRHLTLVLRELDGANSEKCNIKDFLDAEFVLGEKTAFVECLELIKEWEGASSNGLDFNIEDRFPLD